MSRRPTAPLRPLMPDERACRDMFRRSRRDPASVVRRATALLAVADGVGALIPRHGGGARVVYTARERARILAEAHRVPERARDGTATWSLTTLQRAWRRAPDGLPHVSTYTIGVTVHEAGYRWQRRRPWCPTGQAVRRRTTGTVTVHDPDAAAKKN